MLLKPKETKGDFVMSRVTLIKSSAVESWEDMVNQFIYFNKARGLRDSTLEMQRLVLNIYYTRYPDAVSKPRNAVITFMSEEISPYTYNYRLSYLKSFYDWCIDEKICASNPTVGLKKRKVDDKVVDIKQETLKKLFELPNRKTFAGLRDYGLIVLTLDTGIRPKEAFQLLPSDVDLRSMEVHIRTEVSKTNVARTLPISYITVEVIRK